MMYENQMKALRWLANMFPYTHPTKSETDKMSNCIHLYCEQGANAIEELSMKLHGDEAAIAGMKREIERMVVADKPSWIPVSERLPEFKVNDGGVIHTSTVLYRRGKEKTVHLGYVIKTTVVNSNTEEIFVFNRWYDQYGELWEDVTHWMPLPEQPKEEV